MAGSARRFLSGLAILAWLVLALFGVQASTIGHHEIRHDAQISNSQGAGIPTLDQDDCGICFAHQTKGDSQSWVPLQTVGLLVPQPYLLPQESSIVSYSSRSAQPRAPPRA